MSYCGDESKQVIPNGWDGSTNLNNSIQSYSDLAFRIKTSLGHPALSIAVTDSMIATYIDEAIEIFTKYRGAEKEYMVFCSDLYVPGCGIQLDTLPPRRNACCETDPCANGIDYFEKQNTIVSAETEKTLIGSGVGLLSAWNIGIYPNLSGCIQVEYDLNDPWDFNVCSANKIELSALNYPPTINLTDSLSSLETCFSNNTGFILPEDWETKDKCDLSLSAWWGLTGFEPTILSATHVIITNVPSNTIEGKHALVTKSTRAFKYQICNDKIDTGGTIPAVTQFVICCEPPTSLLDKEFDLTTNTGFKVKYCSNTCVDPTPPGKPINIGIDFYDCQTTEVSSTQTEIISAGNFDAALDDHRKVVSVCGIETGDFGNIGNGSFGIFNGSVFGNASFVGTGNVYSGFYSNMNECGWDLLSYDIFKQFAATTRILFHGDISFDFNRDTQTLRLFPEPGSIQNGGSCGGCDWCGVLTLYRERPIRYLIKERWIREYATALTRIGEGQIRSRYAGVELAGGVTVNDTYLEQGIADRDRLLDEIKNEIDGLDSVNCFMIG